MQSASERQPQTPPRQGPGSRRKARLDSAWLEKVPEGLHPAAPGFQKHAHPLGRAFATLA